MSIKNVIKPIVNLLYGLATFIPGFPLVMRTGGTDNARYCYSVWMRHLVMAYRHGFSTIPDVVAELGPGDSIGTGLAALLSGANKYFALDVARYAGVESNIKIFEELITLFRSRASIPDDGEFPKVKPKLETYHFPDHILANEKLKACLDEYRLDRIIGSILNPDSKTSIISYVAPWNDLRLIERASVDMFFSQAVMEHIDDLVHAYKFIIAWLKPSGFLSEQIDFKSHGTATKWNGHWTYSDIIWELMKGKRPYWINREPHSAHIRLLVETGFEVICDITEKFPSEIARDSLAPQFRDLLDEDLLTCGAFIQARIAGYKG